MSEHLGADTLVELVEGRADDTAFARATEHAAGCAACRELLSALARFDRPENTIRDNPKPDEPPERPSMLAIGAHVGRYELVTLLGAGGMGYVYSARDPELERMVALKLLRPDVGGSDAQLVMQERLRREAQAMAQLAHPNVVAVHDVGVFEDRVFVAMEYVQGTNLGRWLADKPRTQREILDAFIAAGRGLAAAHAAGLVHRDFKPENVMVGDDGRVRVGDFGLARPFDTRVARFSKRAADTPTDLTSTGVVLGTPLYMAPEQYLGDPADARTDQFSFCVALHGAIYGARPFAGDTFTDLAASVLSGKIEPTPKGVRVSKRVREAIRRGLALAPGDRWPAMDPLLRELAASPRKRLVWLPAAATGLAAAAGIGLVVTRSSGTPCDRDHLAGVWDDARRTKVERTLAAMDVPFAPATAAEVMRLGDRYADAFLSARVGACEAHDHGELKSDAYALESICFVLRKRDLDAIVDRLEHADPWIAAHAVDAMSNLMPVSRCSDREMLRLLVGPPDANTRVAINRVISELHGVNAALVLGDETLQLGPILKQARAVDAPAVRAEALELAGRYAVIIADFQNARHWLADAAADARSGHHDTAEASALAALLDVKHELRNADDGLRQEARQAGERVRDRPEIEIARLAGEAAIDADRNQVDDAKRELDAAIAIADKQYPDRDQRRGAPREAMIRILVDAGRAADAKPYADALFALRKDVLGEHHPAFATATMLAGDIQAASRDVAAAVDSYHRAIDIANRAKAPRVEAEALAHFAALHVLQGDTAAARALYDRAIALDATAYSRPHPAPARHLVAAAVLEAKLGNRAKASELYRRALAAQRALYDASDPRIAETERALAD